MANKNGTLVILSLEGSPLVHVDNATYNSSFSLAQATDKDSGGNMEYLEGAGLKERTIDVAGNADFTIGTGNIDILMQHQEDRELVAFSFIPDSGRGVSGDAFVSDLSYDTPNEETSTFTATLTVSGAITLES